MKTKKPDVVYRITEKKRRVGHASMQRYTCVINGIACKGFMSDTIRRGEKVQETTFGLEVRPGFDWHWLAAKNGRRFKKPETVESKPDEQQPNKAA